MEDLEETCKKLKQLYEDLTECPICFGTMDSTLKQCINGHGVCSSCASKITKCPSCKQGLLVQKNILLGRLLESFPKPCPNFARGCKTFFSNKEHELFCEFRVSKCMKKYCDWEGCIKYLMSHVKTCVKGSDLSELTAPNTDTKNVYSINNTERQCVLIIPVIFHNQLFWKYCYRNGKTKRFSYAFHHVAVSKPTCSYYFIVSFKKGDITYFTHCCKASTDFNGRVSDVDKSGFFIPDSELDRFRQPRSNKYIYYMKAFTEGVH